MSQINATAMTDAEAVARVSCDLARAAGRPTAELDPETLERVGHAYLAASVRLERLAAQCKNRGIAYLGI